MLIDNFLPDYNFSQKHTIAINAAPAKIFSVLKYCKFNSSLIKILLTLRGIKVNDKSFSLSEKSYFTLLGEDNEKEILFGIVGKFWKWKGGLFEIQREEFKDFSLTGFTKAVWSFSASFADSGKTVLSTETRVQCIGESAKRWFSFYWFLIEPFSGLIRRLILFRIKYQSEKSI